MRHSHMQKLQTLRLLNKRITHALKAFGPMLADQRSPGS